MSPSTVYGVPLAPVICVEVGAALSLVVADDDAANDVVDGMSGAFDGALLWWLVSATPTAVATTRAAAGPTPAQILDRDRDWSGWLGAGARGCGARGCGARGCGAQAGVVGGADGGCAASVRGS
jgi:hypothetical protein